ncbi:integrator complex subunit 6 [Copidosoma floridanum]|uniref:integrator complex subunit 6 n=1 Tax=Copidosoma floridanum TaxID=29053 RepID=UPI000C6FA15A|nr:integrator complex subunit 6 [Copidosoma floridanum]
MTIIVFLIDTSASMNQRVYMGGRPTLLDVAKSAVEYFVKVRQRSPESRGDRYMLLTFEESPNNIKAGWKENLATFMNELKNLQCVGLTTLGGALKNAFDILNINRMQTGIDTYGMGRCPFYLEPSVIVVITDGGKYTTSSGVHQDFTLPMHAPIPGSELTKEPFRWDQRLFSLVLRMAGTPTPERDIGLVASDSSPIDAMCEVTGGRSYCVTTHRIMQQCIDSLVAKVQSGVVINFEKIGPDPSPLTGEANAKSYTDIDEDHDDEMNGQNSNGPVLILNNLNNNNTAWHACRRLIYVPRSAQKGFAVGFWPIPENFWPDVSASSLPARTAHPNVKFTCTSQEPLVIENLPFDKYELEPSPLTQYILARKQPTICWQVFIANSYKSSEVAHPFGYLKASTNLTCVNLFVMPYNYPVLLPLLDDLFKVHRLKPSNEWRTQFQNYMRTMPAYYAASLRRALTRMGAPAALAQTLIPDNMDSAVSYSVMNYLKRVKNIAKSEYDRICNEVISRQVANKSLINNSANTVVEGLRVTPRGPLKKDSLANSHTDIREDLNKFSNFVVGLVKNQQQQRGAQSYRNAFDIPRKSLLDQVVRMRANFLQPGLLYTKLVDDDCMHSLPVSQMGNYQEYLKRAPPALREIESTPVRQHMFGNPFKIDKRYMVDEADIDIGSASSTKGSKRSITMESSSLGSGNNLRMPNKRKPGPIPKDVVVRRPTTPTYSTTSPVYTPPHSPVPWSYSDFKYPASPPTTPPPTSLTTPTTIVPTGAVVRNLNSNSNNNDSSVSAVTLLGTANAINPTYSNSSSAIMSLMMPNKSSNGAMITEQKLVNGDLSYAASLGAFEPSSNTDELVVNSSASADGAFSAAYANHSSNSAEVTALTNNLDGIVKSISSGVSLANSVCKTELQAIKNELRLSSMNVDGQQLENNSSSVGKFKCAELDAAGSTSYSSNSSSSSAATTSASGAGSCSASVSSSQLLTNHVDERTIKSEVKVERQLTSKELEDIRKHNVNIRTEIYKLIRRKGNNFSSLFSHLQMIQGSLDTRLAFVRDIVHVAMRFKRRLLADMVEDYLKKLQEEGKGIVLGPSKTLANGGARIT